MKQTRPPKAQQPLKLSAMMTQGASTMTQEPDYLSKQEQKKKHQSQSLGMRGEEGEKENSEQQVSVDVSPINDMVCEFNSIPVGSVQTCRSVQQGSNR